MNLLENARCSGHEGRPDDRQVVDDPVYPAVHRRNEPRFVLGGEQQLAEDMGQRQPQKLHVVGPDNVLTRHRRAQVEPVGMGQLHPFGSSRGARGVDDRRELIATDRPHGLDNSIRVFSKMPAAEQRQLRKREDRIIGSVGVAVEQHNMAHRGFGGSNLCQLITILGEDDDSAGVRQDVADTFGVRTRVHSGGRRAGQRNGEIGKDPFQTGRAGNGNPVFREHTQGKQTCGEVRGTPSSLRPRQGQPARIRLIGRTERRCMRRPPGLSEETRADRVKFVNGESGHVTAFVWCCERRKGRRTPCEIAARAVMVGHRHQPSLMTISSPTNSTSVKTIDRIVITDTTQV